MSHRCSRSALVVRAAQRTSTPRVRIGHVHRHGDADDTAMAHWFYCDVLDGRQVWPSERAADRTLWFQVGSELLAVRRDPEAVVIPARLVVDDPTAIAERCWDAGFSVHVREAASGEAALAVVDPFGRRLVLVPRAAATVTAPPRVEEST